MELGLGGFNIEKSKSQKGTFYISRLMVILLEHGPHCPNFEKIQIRRSA
jgi:hypothetical protein